MENKEMPDEIWAWDDGTSPCGQWQSREYTEGTPYIRKDLVNQNGWRDIESAPRDGAWIIVLSGKNIIESSDTPYLAGWSEGFLSFRNGLNNDTNPTYWMPLPTPPTASDLSNADEQPTVGNSVDREVFLQHLINTIYIEGGNITNVKCGVIARKIRKNIFDNYNVTKKGE